MTLLAGVALVTAAATAQAATLTVNAGGDLQGALNAARPGDTILLQAGATFVGPYVLPAKNGTLDITVRSSASDSSLPGAGVRISPAYSSLLPKLRSTGAGAAIQTAPGASHWRLMFLEFLPAPGTTTASLVEFGTVGRKQSSMDAVPRFLTLDRCYLHGNPSTGQRRGVALNSGDSRVINSYFADFKSRVDDTQAIAGWNGPGPFLVENNYLEAAGENIMFGGGDPSIPNLVPANITIRRNLISRPFAWRTQGWTVKNLLELKNAQDVRIEGNTFENHWVAGQQGSAIVFTPRNQDKTAPWSVVRNVVFQNNILRHVSSGFNITGYDDEAPSRQTDNIVVRNNLLYDISTAYTARDPAPARLAIIGSGPKDVRFDHNTVDSDGSATVFLYRGKAPAGTKISGFELTNNLLRDNLYGIFGDAVGEGVVALNALAPNSTVLRNAIAGASPRQYPTGNDYPTLAQWKAGFVAPSSGNYTLVAASISRAAGTDGKNLGVDFGELNKALNTTSAPTPTPTPTPTPAPTPGPGPTPAPQPGPGTSNDTLPYTGSPIALPGKIEAENYDTGGADVAYRDTTPGNSGGVYRSNNVDIQKSGDTAGGYSIGWTTAGEWLKYTVNVRAARTYAVDVRVASKGAGGRFHLEVDGVKKTGAITVPATGGWQTWKTVTVPTVALPAGRHVIRLVMDANGASGSVGNINWIAVR